MRTPNRFDAKRRASARHLRCISAAGNFSLDASRRAGRGEVCRRDQAAVKLMNEHKPTCVGGPLTWTVLGPMLFFVNRLPKEFIGRVDPQDISHDRRETLVYVRRRHG